MRLLAPTLWAFPIILALASPGLIAPRPASAAMKDADREAQLEARVRELEGRVDALRHRLERRSATAPDPGTTAGPVSGPTNPSTGIARSAPDLGLVPKPIFGPGFQFSTADDEFLFQFHNLTQVDGRFFLQPGQDPVHNTFSIPRQWLIVNGRLTKPFEYYVALAEGFNVLNLLDAFINVHYDDRLQIKAGRYFIPFTYELYALPIQGLILPERSLFFNNFSNNRDLGVMAWGQLAGKRVDYAAGIFNGTRNGYTDANNAKDFVGYLNVRPFGKAGIPALEFLNLGASVDTGQEENPVSPRIFRTIVPAPGNATIGVPFLAFNDGVRESGVRGLCAFHLSYYVRHLSLLAEWHGGFQDYSPGVGQSRVRVPVRSYFVEAGYFLTGETVSSRGLVQPLRPFDLRRGRFGPGAFEIAGRFNRLDLGGQVFSAGLADPNNWTNGLYTVDVGFNWYLTQYVKFAFDWEHAVFDQPVLYRPGGRQLTSDLLLFRVQVRF